MKSKEVVVDSEMEGMRLDRYLRKNFKDEPLSRIFGAIRAGDVKVNGKKSKENYRLALNDTIVIKNLFSENFDNKKSFEKNNLKKIQIQKSDLEKYKKMIIFENEDFFIVNKREQGINMDLPKFLRKFLKMKILILLIDLILKHQDL